MRDFYNCFCVFHNVVVYVTFRSLPDMDVINVNFSSSTTPELLMKNFDHYCEYRRTPNGVVLAPVQLTRWLVIFCDEINLPCPDKYGTQRVISFMRQLVEQVCEQKSDFGANKTFIILERILSQHRPYLGVIGAYSVCWCV